MTQASILSPPKWTPVDFNVTHRERPCGDLTCTGLAPPFPVSFSLQLLGSNYLSYVTGHEGPCWDTQPSSQAWLVQTLIT